MVGKNSVIFHHIALEDVITSKTADHQFIVEESVKDISLEAMFQRMYHNDSIDKEIVHLDGLLKDMVEISKDNRLFRKLLKNQQLNQVIIMLYHCH